MGDRTTPMKFGPEWLRNLSREPGSPGSGGGAPPTTPPIRPVTSIAIASNTTTPPNTSKVLLAKLRYGREEMLALYDRQTAEAPPQLKSIEQLYQPRGKPPYALNNNYEEDTRDGNMRNNPPTGGMNPADRYAMGRGRGQPTLDGRFRPIPMNSESRGRSRGYVRQTSVGSENFRFPSWHNGGHRPYPGAPDEDPNPQRGMWNNGNGMNPPGIRPSVEQADWTNKMPYRKNRQNHTNWRQQHNRDEGEEWRSSDGARRGQEKWEREWPERNNQEKPWTTNRRQWGGDNNEDALPEWAMENTEACGGTFDSSGAFHGYSNDDSNLPKAQDPSYPLARSHTHGSFARSKTVEEGSDEWWASEKAKKLSAKRFDATEVKFKKHVTPGISEENVDSNANASLTNIGASANTGQTRDKSKLESTRMRSATPPTQQEHGYSPELQDEAAALPVKRESEYKHEADKEKDRYQTNYTENTLPSTQQRIDMLLRTEEDPSNERGNYKSVMMTPNNNHLRQIHQNIGTPSDTHKRMTHLFESAKQQARPNQDSDEESQQKQQETKLVEDLLDMNINDELQAQLLNVTIQPGAMSKQMPSPGMQMRMNNPLHNQGMGINQQNPTMPTSTGMPQGSMMRPIGITNSMLNASLGLPLGTGSNMGMPLTSMPPSQIPNSQMLSSNLQALGGNMQNPMQGMQPGLQPGAMQIGGLQSSMQGNGFQPSSGMPGNMQSSGGMNNNLQVASGIPGYQGVGNSSLFMQGSPNTMQNPNDMAIHGQQNLYPMHGLQQPTSQTFNPASMYGNMMQPPPTGPLPNIPLSDQWYYEDPKKTIQGPFTSKEMYNWYRAGFFSADLMVRRACESGLRPLANYVIMPFGPMDLLPPQFNQMPSRFDMRQQTSHDNSIMNAQQVGLGPEVESLWSQPSANDMMWLQQPTTPRDDNNRINNLSMYFWDQPPSMSSSLLPEAITKDMKTEDDILAQMRASQGDPAVQNLSFMPDIVSPEDAFTAGTNIAPNLEELQKLIESDVHANVPQRATAPADTAAVNTAAAAAVSPTLPRPRSAAAEKEKKAEKVTKAEPIPVVSAKHQGPIKTIEPKPAKQPVKVEDKPAKQKEGATKAKTKKQKEEKKDETAEIKMKDEQKKVSEKASEEPSPPKNKKDDKANKKELDKEKKEWLKDGFIIVKGTEKKENKKKEKEEARLAEEAEKKRLEEAKRALIEAEKNRTPEPVTRRQQMEIGQTQRQQSQAAAEVAPKKAPWSAHGAGRGGLALSDIQRLEREKKLEQMKEQQQMMHAIAQQQAAAAHREQHEIQAGQLGWTKKKQSSNSAGQTLVEIQAEARFQAATTAAACEEAQTTPPPVSTTPWGGTNGGFWDSPIPSTPLSAEARGGAGAVREMPKSEPKPKKKVTMVLPSKKEASPSADFESWCNNVLSNWRDAANIDIPTFVAFLRDIESPYEVKDYVKCYLGDTKDSIDFSRQFLERRSRLLRVGMVTPSDDLCSPAAAINPRTNSGSDYTEVKSKGKKAKKNKMFKVDARILGFSVTASEDRINIGDIDSV